MSTLTRIPLRVATAGSVDDGKSTLIGRLLLDAKALMVDQVAHVADASRRRGFARTDLALVTDGLRAEREQGITIDVAWRYFSTPKRRFVLADAPGHVQYTRNMVTACSIADVTVVLVDARSGLTEQTRRHVFVARLLGVKTLVFAINKMDAVLYALDAFARVREDLTAYLASIAADRRPVQVEFVPVSALIGDNVAVPSRAMPWYDGPTLLALLESLPADRASHTGPVRLPVQWVIRPQSAEHPDYRGYAGRLGSGSVRVGQAVRILPSGLETSIAAIETADGHVEEAVAGESVVVHLAENIDVSRGDMIVSTDGEPRMTRDLDAEIAWMSTTPARTGATYLIKHATREVRARLASIDKRYDVTTGAELAAVEGTFGLNTLGRVRIELTSSLAIDAYREIRATGSFLVVDPQTGDTLAAGMMS